MNIVNSTKVRPEKNGDNVILNLGNETIRLYPINTGEEVILNIPYENAKIFAINNNFRDTMIYPLSVTDEIEVNKDSFLLLEQTKWFTTIEIKLSQVENDFDNAKSISEYNL